MKRVNYGTRFQETEIIAAATADDNATILAHLDDMLPGELVEFRAQCQRVISLIEIKLEQS